MSVMEIPVEKGSLWQAKYTKYFSNPDILIIFSNIWTNFWCTGFWIGDLLIYSLTENKI